MAESCELHGTHSPTQLLNLPREIRDLIWFYVLMSPYCTPEYHVLTPPSPTFVPLAWDALLRSIYRSQPSKSYWGSHQMSNILLVNRQIYIEAVKILWSSGKFIFGWPSSSCSCCVKIFLSKRNPRVKSSLKSIELDEIQSLDDSQADYTEDLQKAYLHHTTLLRELPSLKSVTFRIHFVGLVKGDAMKRRAANRIVILASIFRRIDHLDLVVIWSERQQERLDIFQEALARVQEKKWMEFDVAKGSFRCCSRKRIKQLRQKIL